MSSPVFSSKLKVWTGFKNSSVMFSGFTVLVFGVRFFGAWAFGAGLVVVFEVFVVLEVVTLMVFLVVFGFGVALLGVA